MTAAAQAPAMAGIIPRRSPRFPATVPIDLTVLRSGVPDNLPGRTLNLCEGGVAAVIAGELRLREAVGVEFRLPDVAVPFSAKAVVRHERRLRYGLEFVGLSAEQRAMIRYWAGRVMEANREAMAATVPNAPAAARRRRFLWTAKVRRMLGMVAVLAIVATLIGWWHWYRAWSELESELPNHISRTEAELPKVSAASMEQLLTHRVDPIYPEAARQANLQGVVLVKAIVAPDGKVVAVHPVSGPDVLTQAAVDAVRWWRFQPYQVNGRPEEVETTVALEFHP